MSGQKLKEDKFSPTTSSLKIHFDDPRQAHAFKVWLSDQGGESSFYEACELGDTCYPSDAPVRAAYHDDPNAVFLSAKPFPESRPASKEVLTAALAQTQGAMLEMQLGVMKNILAKAGTGPCPYCGRPSESDDHKCPLISMTKEGARCPS